MTAAAERLRVPRPPVALERAYDDVEAVRAMVPRSGPYWPTLRYVQGDAELGAVGGSAGNRPTQVMPWFRGDWAEEGKPCTDGADALLAHEGFAAAARRVFDAQVVRPVLVYVNLMVGIPFSGPAHVDVPAFRGIDRSEYPVWLMHTMKRSGLFEPWAIDIATAVSWLYRGDGGEFDYWPDGADGEPKRISAPLDNRAIVGDNDVMFHRVAAVGSPGATLPEGDPFRSQLEYDESAGDWAIVDDGRVLARHPDRDVRVSISWKAEVFADDGAARLREEHRDDLTLGEVVDRFLADLAERGVACERPEDPLRDSAFIGVLNEAYPLRPPSR